MIGIDLGTTNSLVAYNSSTGPQIIPNELGDDLTPSAIALTKDEQVLVGRAAKDRLVSDPESGIAFFKRDMGSDKTYSFGGRKWSPIECSALVLQALRTNAERHLQQTITSAVISVPAYFNDSQRQATIEAASIAGLSVDRLINEPTAAALAFGYQNPDAEKQVMVFDIGGGTFDITILDIFDNIVEVSASGGISRLGGEDYTEAYLQFLAEKHFVEIGGSYHHRLRQQTEVIKRRFCSESSFKAKFADKEIDASYLDFQNSTSEHTARLKPIVQRALRDAKVNVLDLDDVLLVGGASRMPVIKEFIHEELHQKINNSIDPDRVVALGAAIQAALCHKESSVQDIVLTDVSPHSLGIATAKELSPGKIKDGYFSPIIDRNTTIPCSRSEDFHTLTPKQDQIEIVVYQGEHRRTAENTKLGSFTIKGLHSKNKDSSGQVNVRFTYDMNGLLEVEATRLHDGHKESILIEQRPGALKPGDKQRAIERLAALKIAPEDTLVNRALIERAQRLFEDLQGRERSQLTFFLDQFEAALEEQDKAVIEQTGKLLKDFLSDYFQDEDEHQSF